MILADLGADVIRLERPDGGPFVGGAPDVLTSSRPSVAIDLKDPDAPGLVLAAACFERRPAGLLAPA
jgi:alpha-methylacyl-CoA racemase